MTHFLAVLTNDPSLLRCQLHRVPGAFGFQPGEAVAIGSFEDDDVLLARWPAMAGGGDLLGRVAGIDSPALLALAKEDPPLYEEECPDPFRFRRWLHAMAGSVEGFEAQRAAWVASLPPFLARQLRTATDREHVFSLFLQELHEENAIDDAKLSAQEAARALARSIRRADEFSSRGGATRPSPLLQVATNGRLLVAARRGLPLYYLLLEGSGSCAHCDFDEAQEADDPRVRPHRRAKSVLLTSRPLSSEGLIEVPDGSTVAVGRGLDIAIASL